MKLKTLTSVLLITLAAAQFCPAQTQAAVSLAKPVKQTETVNTVSNGEISAIRYSKAADKVRVVFDLNDTTQYEVKPLDNGYIMVDFSEPISKSYAGGINIGDSSVPFVEIYSDGKMSCAVIQVTDGSAYESGELKGPRRLYVDISKDYEYSITKNLEPGLTQISYYSRKNGERQTAQLVEVDPKYFKFVPVLGGGDKMAKNTVKAMSDYVDAAVAENASYFGDGKELYGVTKIAGDMISSMYLTRTAFGGLAAGIGSALYDLTNPAYIASAPFTFAFKFLLAAVCGWVAWARGSRGENHGQNILAATAGSVTYMVLYLGKSFVEGLLLGSALMPVLLSVGTKAVTSGINGVIAVVVSVPLYAAIRLALKRSRLLG